MTPAQRGEVDELLEPVRSWSERTTLPLGQRRNARQPRLPISDQRTLVRNTTTQMTLQLVNDRACIRLRRHHDQHQHLDTAPLLQECRSALTTAHPGCTEDDEPEGCRDRELRHDGDPVRCWVWSLASCNYCRVR
jgi:hypothetical protein